MNQKASNKTRIAVNGLGRIGRVFLRLAYGNPNFEIAAVSSRSGLETYAHLLKYDSTYGVWDKEVSAQGNNLVIDDLKIPFVHPVRSPMSKDIGSSDVASELTSNGVKDKEGNLPWKEMGIDLVFDATGVYTKKEQAVKHLEHGARLMVCSAPMDDADETFVYAVNHENFDPEKHKIVSAASCTTVCSMLTTKVLEENFGIKQGFINTVHAFTSDQSLLDATHKDLRRARTASQSIIPTSTGVSKTVGKIYPNLKGKVSALSLRVPVVNPSVIVYTVELNKQTSAEEVNQVFVKAAEGPLKRHLAVSNLPLVSTDFRGNKNGAIVDLLATDVVNGSLLNLIAWYDNEMGYVQQALYLIEYLSKRLAR